MHTPPGYQGEIATNLEPLESANDVVPLEPVGCITVTVTVTLTILTITFNVTVTVTVTVLTWQNTPRGNF